MKKIIFLIISALIFSSPSYAAEIPGEEVYNGTVERVISGELDLSPVGIINALVSLVMSEISEVKAFLKSILLIAVFSGVLRVLGDSFEKSGVSDAAHFACFAAMSGLCVRIFAASAGYSLEVIHFICEFITKFEPVFMGLLVTSGAVTQAAAFQPVLAASVYILSILVDKCVLPLTYFSAMLGIINNISGRMSFANLNKLLASGAKWLLTGVLTLFSAILGIYGLGTSALNNVAAKGIKFAVGSLVPVVGGLLSDAVETVVCGTNLLKNAAGTAGMVAVISASAVPIIKIWIMLMLLKVTAAVSEPFADKRVTNMLLGISDSISTLFSVAITSVMLFVISIGIILMSTGVTL